jgi:IS5 family transposase
LSRNFYKEIKGDNNNVMLAAAAMNFKRIMNKWSGQCGIFLFRLFQTLLHFIKAQYSQIFTPFNSQFGF